VSPSFADLLLGLYAVAALLSAFTVGMLVERRTRIRSTHSESA